MSVLNNLLSPISIAFIIILVGYYVGRIKFFEISLDLSGVLIVAVLVGWLLAEINSHRPMVDMVEYETHMKFFSSFGTSLFISAIGISTGTILDLQKWKDMKAILIGSLMVASAFVVMKLISVLDDNISVSMLLGSLCGALTTTPGLSAACEFKNVVLEDLILGYSCTYLFGVVATVLFVQIIVGKWNGIREVDKEVTGACDNKCALSGLIQIGCAVILGRLVGNIEIFNFSLGNSGGMLCSGIVIGLLVKRAFPKRLLTTKMLTPLRNTGLVLFFVGNGMPAGLQISKGIDLKVILYGGLMTIIPIAFGAILYKIFFNDKYTVITIAGGMTSTPAIGVLVEKHTNIPLSKYALAYFGALITIVILIRANLIL